MNSRTTLLLGCICIIAALSISGCNSNLIDRSAASAPPATPPSLEVVNVKPPVVQTIAPLPAESVSIAPTSENKEPTLTKSSDQATAASNNVQQANSAETKDKPLPSFSSKQPEVMGLAIGEAQEKAIAKYGNPLESYIMDDPAEPITVYQYEGFSVGFNSADAIQFIDVSSAKVNPGLSGLRLGQPSSKALDILGKPDKNTSYVISYNTKTAILKLDIDPKTKTILSIKLFGVDES